MIYLISIPIGLSACIRALVLSSFITSLKSGTSLASIKSFKVSSEISSVSPFNNRSVLLNANFRTHKVLPSISCFFPSKFSTTESNETRISIVLQGTQQPRYNTVVRVQNINHVS